jgi:Uma2 family endonuclease
MVALPKIPARMSVAEFLTWDAPDGSRWQLVDGEPEATAPTSNTHAEIQNELGRLIGNHLADRRNPCRVLAAPGIVPRVRADWNFRIPDLAVSCAPHGNNDASLDDPLLIIEILSPSNERETWRNVWTFTTLPSVAEIVVVRTAFQGADALRRRADGSWPDRALEIRTGDLSFDSIGLTLPLAALYRTTRLAAAE